MALLSHQKEGITIETLSIKTKDGFCLSAIISEAKKAKGIVQIIHGAKGHKDRYIPFMKFLNQHGFTVIASDNRGHGLSVNQQYPLGHMENYETLIEDQKYITDTIKTKFPNLDLYLFGHSLGSVIARCYLQKYDFEIKKLILSGTARYFKNVKFGVGVANIINKVEGKYHISNLLPKMNDHHKDDDWICFNPDVIASAKSDPLCNFKHTNSSILAIFRAYRDLKNYKKYQCKNPARKILSITGGDDPVPGGVNGLF